MIFKILNKYNKLVVDKSVLVLLLGLCILQGEQHAMAQGNDDTPPDSFLELQECKGAECSLLVDFANTNFL